MNLITTLPLYRNHFQTPTLFFSLQNFSVGSLIFVPFSPHAQHPPKKPALVIESGNLDKEKFFLRKNKILIKKLDGSAEYLFFSEKIIKFLLLISEKKQLPLTKLLEKILSKKTISQINKLSPRHLNEIKNIQETAKKITVEYIKIKFKTPFPRSIPSDKNVEKKIKSIGEFLLVTKKKNTALHSEKHYLVDEIRNYFGETAKQGIGSFSFYLGFFKKIPEATIYQYWSEVKNSQQSTKKQQKLFWWKIGQFLKNKQKSKKL